MKNKLVLTLSLAASCLLTNVQAQEAIPVLSTKELVDVCKVSTTGEYRSYCVGYMTSAYDTYLATRNPKHANHLFALNNLHLQEMKLLMAI